MRVNRRIGAAMAGAVMAVGVMGVGPTSAEAGNDNHKPPCQRCHEGDGPTIVWWPPSIDPNPPADPPEDPPAPKPDPKEHPPLESDCIDADGDGENDDDCQTVENGLWNSGEDGTGSPGGYGGSKTGPIVLQ